MGGWFVLIYGKCRIKNLLSQPKDSWSIFDSSSPENNQLVNRYNIHHQGHSDHQGHDCHKGCDDHQDHVDHDHERQVREVNERS